jgi:fatty acid desaturase
MSDPAEGVSRQLPKSDWEVEARALVRDLLPRNASTYWLDLLLTLPTAWLLTLVYLHPDAGLWLWPAGFAAGVLFYRGATFMHEIVHMREREMLGFKRTWNALIGIPFCAPWILYRSHTDHHNRMLYGTPADGEYLPLGASPRRELLLYVGQLPLLPLLAWLRFGVLAPMSWLHRGLREWVLTHASAAVINPYTGRRFPASEEQGLLRIEIPCALWAWMFVGLNVAEVISGAQLGLIYVLLIWTLGLNWVRTLAAHDYTNTGAALTREEQYLDSINLTGQTWLTCWLFPVGLRYHALHHLFPGLPYHNMGEAHRRLSAALAPDSPYHRVNRDSFGQILLSLWRASGTAQTSAMQRWRSGAAQ